MGPYVADKAVKLIIANKKEITTAKILLMGITFKENVSDIRNSRVIDIIEELQKYNITVDVVDAFAKPKEVKHEYNVDMIKEPKGKYTAVIVAVNHKPYLNLEEKDFANLLVDNGVLIDIKGIYRNKIKNLTYWSL
jgi:UDP-N-acetyl-D-galactosamine dehydrogenase